MGHTHFLMRETKSIGAVHLLYTHAHSHENTSHTSSLSSSSSSRSESLSSSSSSAVPPVAAVNADRRSNQFAMRSPTCTLVVLMSVMPSSDLHSSVRDGNYRNNKRGIYAHAPAHKDTNQCNSENKEKIIKEIINR